MHGPRGSEAVLLQELQTHLISPSRGPHRPVLTIIITTSLQALLCNRYLSHFMNHLHHVFMFSWFYVAYFRVFAVMFFYYLYRETVCWSSCRLNRFVLVHHSVQLISVFSFIYIHQWVWAELFLLLLRWNHRDGVTEEYHLRANSPPHWAVGTDLQVVLGVCVYMFVFVCFTIAVSQWLCLGWVNWRQVCLTVLPLHTATRESDFAVSQWRSEPDKAKLACSGWSDSRSAPYRVSGFKRRTSDTCGSGRPLERADDL